MAFTNSLSETDLALLIISQIRLEIGDHVEDAGVRPDGTNYADDQIQYFYDRGTTIDEAVIAIFENLAGAWAGRSDNVSIGRWKISGGSSMSDHYEKMANKIRERGGLTAGVIQHDFQQTSEVTDLI